MNKKILSVGMVVTLILTIMSLGGCKDEEKGVTPPDPMSDIPQVKSLTSPDNDYVVDLSTAGPLTFSWPAASRTDNSYEIFFFEPGDFANPIIKFQADGDGADTKATLSRLALAQIVKTAGVPNGNKVTLQWGVYTLQSDSKTKVISKEFRTITIEGTYRDPALTSLTPDELTWDATSTEAKSIVIAGDNLDGANITLSALTNYTTNLEGSTITVTPNGANATAEDIVETLTVSVEGGNSLTATLTQTKPEVAVPALTSLTPDELTWDATSTEAKSIVIAGDNLDGANITLSALTNYTTNIVGTTITVTPNGVNATGADIVEILTVSVDGGNPLQATLTHTKAVVPQPAGSWVKVTADRADWSGTYLVVRDGVNYPRAWNMGNENGNQFFVTVGENNAITAAGTAQGGDDIALESLNDKTVTIAKVEGGYTIQMMKTGDYITNTSGAAGTVMQEESVIGANTISLNADNNVEIHLDNSTGFGYFPQNNRFNYFPDSAWGNKVYISLYEYKE